MAYEKEHWGKGQMSYADIAPLMAGSRGRKAEEEGDPDGGIWSAGQGIGLIDDVPTCQQVAYLNVLRKLFKSCQVRHGFFAAQVVDRLMQGAVDTIQERLESLVRAPVTANARL